MSAESLVKHIINKFNKKMTENEEARAEVKSIVKTININLDDESYSFKLAKAEITNFQPTLLDNADISIVTTVENLKKLIDGSLRPMKAYVTKKVIVRGKVQDLLYLKKLF